MESFESTSLPRPFTIILPPPVFGAPELPVPRGEFPPFPPPCVAAPPVLCPPPPPPPPPPARPVKVWNIN